MKALVLKCRAAMTTDTTRRSLEPSEMRAALVACLRDEHACTLEQIGRTLELSAERVRQVYQTAKRAKGQRARQARAPVEELSSSARQGLADVGLAPDASMHDVTVLLPMLRLAAKLSDERASDATLQAQFIDRATLNEIEEWLRRHGVAFR